MPEDDITAVITDMRLKNPVLCASIRPGFELECIYSPDMIYACDRQFLRLVATTIAMQNLATRQEYLELQLRDTKNGAENQAKIIGRQALTISNLSVEISLRKYDSIHLAQETWGFGHAETAGPIFHYTGMNDPSPIPPEATTAEHYQGTDERETVLTVAFPQTTRLRTSDNQSSASISRSLR